MTEKQKQNLREKAKMNPNYGMKGRKHSEKTKSLMRRNRMGKRRGKNNTFWGKRHSTEAKNKMSAKRKVFFANNPGAAKEHSRKIKELYATKLEQHIVASNAQKKRYENPIERERSRMINSKKWENPDFIRKQMRSRNVAQNKAEVFCGEILEKWFPGKWKFVGDGKKIIGKKCPDFWDGEGVLLELYGDYWHKGQNPQDRIDYFKEYGYECLVIWEHELENLVLLREKLNHGSEQES